MTIVFVENSDLCFIFIHYNTVVFNHIEISIRAVPMSLATQSFVAPEMMMYVSFMYATTLLSPKARVMNRLKSTGPRIEPCTVPISMLQ